MAAVIIISIAIATATYFLGSITETYIIDHFLMTPEKLAERVDAKFDDLQDYIKKEDVEGTDIKKINKWIKTKKQIYISISTDDKIVLESAWWDFSINETPDDVISTVDRTYSQDPEFEFVPSNNNREIKFVDGTYYVYIEDFLDYKLYVVVNNAILIFSFFVLLVLILSYNRHTTKRVIKLYKEVKMVSEEGLYQSISSHGNDELGALANGVDNMRESIIEELANEEMAWNANCQLITAMSHDIRTPLTSLIGYLDIIQGEKYKSPEELKKYINSCSNKALQLKDLSDKMFEYFLVYGKQDVVLEKEIFSVEILFEQIVGEHVLELESQGYDISIEVDGQERYISTEITYIRRLFDNLFSNMIKYADKQKPILIRATFAGEFLIFNFSNYIRKDAGKVESTRIGIKTCETICERLGATFSCGEKENIFNTTIGFKIFDKEEVEDDK